MAWIVSDGDSSANLLNEDQALNNMVEIYNYLSPKGCTLNSIAAAGGNIWYESHINPGQWEIGYNMSTSRGYGLVQWTPATKLINWAENLGIAWRGNGDNQIRFVYENNEQWYPSYDPRAPQRNPPITFREFWTVDLPLQTLTEYWYFYYEQPPYSDPSIPDRIAHAEKYYEYLSGKPPKPPDPPEPIPTVHKKIPVSLWIKRIL